MRTGPGTRPGFRHARTPAARAPQSDSASPALIDGGNSRSRRIASRAFSERFSTGTSRLNRIFYVLFVMNGRSGSPARKPGSPGPTRPGLTAGDGIADGEAAASLLHHLA